MPGQGVIARNRIRFSGECFRNLDRRRLVARHDSAIGRRGGGRRIGFGDGPFGRVAGQGGGRRHHRTGGRLAHRHRPGHRPAGLSDWGPAGRGDTTSDQPAGRGRRCARGSLGDCGSARQRPAGQGSGAGADHAGGRVGTVQRASRDHGPGAFNDIAASLAEGSPSTGHRCPVDSIRRWSCSSTSRRCPPRSPASLTGMTTLSPVTAIEESLAITMLDRCASAAGAEVVRAQLCFVDAVENVAEQQY